MKASELEDTGRSYMDRLYGPGCLCGEDAIEERQRREQKHKARQRAMRRGGTLDREVIRFLRNECELTSEGTRRIFVHDGVRYNTTGLMEHVLCDRFGLEYGHQTMWAIQKACVDVLGHRIVERSEQGPTRNPGRKPMPEPQAQPDGAAT